MLIFSLILFNYKIQITDLFLMENYDQGLFNLSKHVDEAQPNYYHQYCRLYLANVVLTSQIKELINQKNEILNKLTKYQQRNQENDGSQNNEKHKRHRRTANQINRHYKCSIQICQKSYGSQGSLNQHIKLKHPQLFSTMLHAICSKEDYQQQEYELMSKLQKSEKVLKKLPCQKGGLLQIK